MTATEEKLNNDLKKMSSLIGTDFYTQDEVNKLINAFVEKYKISECEELPYYPKPTKILLSGTEIK